jgi:hypothetical protein
VDLGPATPLLQRMQQLSGGRSSSNVGQTAAAAEQADFQLTVAFVVRAASSSSAPPPPLLQLQAPQWFRYLPHFTLPSWDAHTSLIEFVPHLAERIERHLAEACPAAVQRYSLFDQMGRHLGPALEVNMAPSSSHGSSSHGGSSGGGGGGGLPRPASPSPAVGSSSSSSRVWAQLPAAASASATAVFHVHCEQQPLLLYMALPHSYPTDAPVLALQNIRWGCAARTAPVCQCASASL